MIIMSLCIPTGVQLNSSRSIINASEQCGNSNVHISTYNLPTIRNSYIMYTCIVYVVNLIRTLWLALMMQFPLAGSYAKLIATYTFAGCVIILAIYHLIKEFIWLIYTRRKYFCDIQNYTEIPLFTASIAFVFVFDQCCPQSWQWQIGIIVIFLGWINLIFFASNFPLTAVYVIMFKTIVVTFLKLLLFALLLIIAFSLILFMMFHNPAAKVIWNIVNWRINQSVVTLHVHSKGWIDQYIWGGGSPNFSWNGTTFDCDSKNTSCSLLVSMWSLWILQALIIARFNT